MDEGISQQQNILPDTADIDHIVERFDSECGEPRRLFQTGFRAESEHQKIGSLILIPALFSNLPVVTPRETSTCRCRILAAPTNVAKCRTFSRFHFQSSARCVIRTKLERLYSSGGDEGHMTDSP